MAAARESFGEWLQQGKRLVSGDFVMAAAKGKVKS